MSPSKLLPLAICALWGTSALTATAQVNTDYTITNVESNFVESPSYSGPAYNKRRNKASNWLEVEVAFNWEPRAKDPKYTDELTFNYYILLKAKTKEDPNGILLSGTVTHVNIPQGSDLHSVVYVSPRSLERFFEGKVPNNVKAAVEAVAVTISKQGQIVAEYTGGNFKSQWWSSFRQNNGFVLNKNETPFAPLEWDYYEAIKAKN